LLLRYLRSDTYVSKLILLSLFFYLYFIIITIFLFAVTYIINVIYSYIYVSMLLYLPQRNVYQMGKERVTGVKVTNRTKILVERETGRATVERVEQSHRVRVIRKAKVVVAANRERNQRTSPRNRNQMAVLVVAANRERNQRTSPRNRNQVAVLVKARAVVTTAEKARTVVKRRARNPNQVAVAVVRAERRPRKEKEERTGERTEQARAEERVERARAGRIDVCY
jgi:hypothetical protein